MKLPPPLHRWNVPVREAVTIQRRLATMVRTTGKPRSVRNIAGLDAAFTRDGKFCLAAVVVWDLVRGAPVEQQTAKARLLFPYIPGLLSFREAPALLAALKKLKTTPDILMCDGQGLAHPRRLGIASHVGLVSGIPSIGCAKSILIGTYGSLRGKRGARAALCHQEKRIGTVVRTRDGVKPVYVSVGHGMNLATAERIVLWCAKGYRLPEPVRLADQLSKRQTRCFSPPPSRSSTPFRPLSQPTLCPKR